MPRFGIYAISQSELLSLVQFTNSDVHLYQIRLLIYYRKSDEESGRNTAQCLNSRYATMTSLKLYKNYYQGPHIMIVYLRLMLC
jgi:hypothetical protein